MDNFLFFSLILASTGSVVAQDDSTQVPITQGMLEFIAGTECVDMPTGVSKLFFNDNSLKSGQALTVVEMLDSAVIDGSVVADMTSPVLQMLAFSPDFTDFLAQYDIEYVARNVPPAVPGETFDVFSDGTPRSYDLSVFYRVHFDEALDLDVVLADLEAVACVDSAAYWPVAQLYADDPPGDTYNGPFRDQLSDEQWYLRAPDSANPGGIDIDGAWACIWNELTSYPLPEVVVGIVDGSFGTELHVDLQENAHPESLIEYDTLPWDPHGSWVAGIVSAAAGNRYERGGLAALCDPGTVGIGVTGIAPSLKAVFTGQPNPFLISKALEQFSYLLYDVDTDIDVVNISWGIHDEENATLRALTEVAYYDRGIVLVAAAGYKEGQPYDAYPAVYDYVISVGANRQSGAWASDFSNYGPDRVDLLAPGVDILTTGYQMPKPAPPLKEVDENAWSTHSGTSMSAPMITGVVALMKVANPQLSAATVQDILTESCRPAVGFEPGFNDTTGYGIINAQVAVARAKQLANTVCDSLPGDVDADCYVNYGDIKYLSDYMYLGGPPPEYLNNADVNGDCALSIVDLSYLIDYIFGDGPEPVPGCVEDSQSADVNPDALPGSPQLGQNYPNPFNPETVIRFRLAGAAHVNLEVFNMLGRKIVMLVDGRLEKGEHVVQWDGCDSGGRRVASGVYLYRLSTDGAVMTRKMLLLK